MTEKRFTIDEDGEYFDRVSQKYVTIDYLMGLVNEQHRTIQDLNVRLNFMTDQKNQFYRKAVEKVNRVGQLEEENEKLKEQLKNLRKLANELYMEGSE